MRRQKHGPSPRLVSLALLILALASGCHTTRIQDASQVSGLPIPSATRMLVLFDGRPGSFRAALEDALAIELRRHGAAAEVSIGRLDLESFEADPTGVARQWSARTGQSLLVLRPLAGESRFENKDRRGRYDTGGAALPTSVIKPKDRSVHDTMNAHEFAAASGAPSVVPGYAMSEERWVSEIAFLDPTTGRAVWTARIVSTLREGQDEARWMADLARVVVRRLRQERLVP